MRLLDLIFMLFVENLYPSTMIRLIKNLVFHLSPLRAMSRVLTQNSMLGGMITLKIEQLSLACQTASVNFKKNQLITTKLSLKRNANPIEIKLRFTSNDLN